MKEKTAIQNAKDLINLNKKKLYIYLDTVSNIYYYYNDENRHCIHHNDKYIGYVTKNGRFIRNKEIKKDE